MEQKTKLRACPVGAPENFSQKLEFSGWFWPKIYPRSKFHLSSYIVEVLQIRYMQKNFGRAPWAPEGTFHRSWSFLVGFGPRPIHSQNFSSLAIVEVLHNFVTYRRTDGPTSPLQEAFFLGVLIHLCINKSGRVDRNIRRSYRTPYHTFHYSM